MQLVPLLAGSGMLQAQTMKTKVVCRITITVSETICKIHAQFVLKCFLTLYKK